MKKEKFLTVMAVLDDNTQKLMDDIQKKLINEVSQGTQTMDIPFHITLGSYPIDSEGEIMKKIKETAENTKSFPIKLFGYNNFGKKVIYLEPSMPDELLNLRKEFECDYAEEYDWIPHATLFCCEDEEFNMAKERLPIFDEPISAEIVGIELGEFFPARKIIREAFR